jgi:hypothetical protein
MPPRRTFAAAPGGSWQFGGPGAQSAPQSSEQGGMSSVRVGSVPHWPNQVGAKCLDGADKPSTGFIEPRRGGASTTGPTGRTAFPAYPL